MRQLGWIMQTWCDHRVLPEVADLLREVAGEMPVVLDHILHMSAERGTGDPGFQTLLRLVGEGVVHVKLSAPYRLSQRYPDYEDASRSTRRCCAPIRSGSSGAPTGRIRRSPPN